MMMSLRVFPRRIGHYLKQSQLHTSVKLLATKDSSSSSSSSDSSDSDADKDDKSQKQENVKTQKENDFLSPEKTNERLNTLLLKLSEASKQKEALQKAETASETGASNVTDKSLDSKETEKSSKSINVALKPRKIRLKKSEDEKKPEKPIEEQIIGAAKNVAETLGGDTQKTELELLSQILNLEPKETKNETSDSSKETAEKPVSLSDLLSGMKVDKPFDLQERRQKKAAKTMDRFREPSIAKTLLYQKSLKIPQRTTPPSQELNVESSGLGIFKNLPEKEPENVLQLSTWNAMEQKEMKLSTLITPQNVFQELILWTEQGKLWHFPINNEQGMEEEEKVHFSEHVFLERHLKDWCPKKGPVRHFMELVCTGLSKNPYMTVNEKIGHITWYKEYFESKKELLQDLGALGDKPPPSDKPTEKKQIEA